MMMMTCLILISAFSTGTHGPRRRPTNESEEIAEGPYTVIISGGGGGSSYLSHSPCYNGSTFLNVRSHNIVLYCYEGQ